MSGTALLLIDIANSGSLDKTFKLNFADIYKSRKGSAQLFVLPQKKRCELGWKVYVLTTMLIR